MTLAPEIIAGDLQIYLGNPAQGGSIQRFAQGTGEPLPPQPELIGLHLLPLDYNTRLATDLTLDHRPHLLEDIPGAGRIVLPGEFGVLYHYCRSLPGQAPSFGFLRIDGQANPQLYAERPGSGVNGDQDPYNTRIALAPDGRSMLLTSQLAAGGDLFEVDLQSGQVIDRSAGQAALNLLPQSTRLQGTWAIAVATNGVYRANRAAASQLSAVALDAETVFYGGGVVVSADGSKALTTAGLGANLLHAWVFGEAGLAQRASCTAGPMTGAGYLPESDNGPLYVVDNDGDLCVWCMDQIASREIFARRSCSPATQPDTQLTGDANFTDTLDEAGVLNMFRPGRLVMAVGEATPDLVGGMENVDFFLVTLSLTGVPSITNITATSGDTALPYLETPELSPTFQRWLPAAQSFFYFDAQGGRRGELAAFDPLTTGVQVVMDDVKEVFFVIPMGDQLLISLRTARGDKSHQLVSIPADLSGPATVLLDTGSNQLLHPVVDRSGWLAFLEVPVPEPLPGLQTLHRYQAASGTHQVFPLTSMSFGPVIAWNSIGELTFSLENAGQLYFAVWPTVAGGTYRIQAMTVAGAVLPGR